MPNGPFFSQAIIESRVTLDRDSSNPRFFRQIMSEQMTYLDRLVQSRWNWFLQGLPSVARARALFRVRRQTMTSPVRCRHLWDACNEVLKAQIPETLSSVASGAVDLPGSWVWCSNHTGKSVICNGSIRLLDCRSRRLTMESARRSTAAGRASGALQSVDQCRAEVEAVRDFLFNQLESRSDAG